MSFSSGSFGTAYGGAASFAADGFGRSSFGAPRAAAGGGGGGGNGVGTKSMFFHDQDSNINNLVAYSDNPNNISPVNVALGAPNPPGSPAWSFSVWLKPADFGDGTQADPKGWLRPTYIFHCGGGGDGDTGRRALTIYGIRAAGDYNGRNALAFESGQRTYGGGGRYFRTNQLPDSFADYSTWSHVVGTYPGGTDATSTGSIYIDGVYQLGTGSSAGSVTSPGVWPQNNRGPSLGTSPAVSTTARCFSGSMCDAAVWDKELSQAEVTTIYGEGSRVDLSTTGPTSNIVAWWKMGDGVLIKNDGTKDTDVTDSITRIYCQTSSLGNWPQIVSSGLSREGFEMTGSNFAAGSIKEDSP